MKYIVDVQDLWPESFCMAIKNPLLQKGFLPMTRYVNKAYAAADGAFAVSQTYVKRVLKVNAKVKSGLDVFLGNDGELFDEGREKYLVKRNDNELWLCYIGSMSTSYDINCVIDALAIIKAKGINNIRFVLIGKGEKYDEFKQYAQKKEVLCDFVGFKPYHEMVGLMCACDMVVNPIVKGSAASIINKVGDYAMSGLPVINSQECQEYRDLIEKYQCGINVKCGDAADMAKAIEILAFDKALREAMGRNAIKLGKEKFDRRYTYGKIADEIESICGKKTGLKVTIIVNFPGGISGQRSKGRFLYLGELLSERGHKVEMIVSDFSHGAKKHYDKGAISDSYKTKLIAIHEPGYKKNVSIKRLYSHYVWGKNVGKYLKSKTETPDCIYCAIPSITAAVKVAKYCDKQSHCNH